MPSYPDAIAIAQGVLSANLPSTAVGQDDLTYNIIAAVAAALDTGYNELQATYAQMNPSTATGLYLDDLANMLDVYRMPDSKATGAVVFTLTPGPVFPQTIFAGTIVSTVGNPSAFYATSVDAIIPTAVPPGSPSSSPSIPVQETVGIGAAGNILPGMIQIVNFQLAPGVVTVTNPTATTGGADAENDDALRARYYTAALVKYGADDLNSNVRAVPGVYDVWINDPSAPPNTDVNPAGTSTSTGGYNCYWCDIFGAQPGAGTPNTGVALAVQNTLTASQPPGVIPTFLPFTVVQVTAVSVSYRATVGLAALQIEPLIQAAVVGYLQSLGHNQIPDTFNLGLWVQQAVGYALTFFIMTSITPAIGLASHSTIYRCAGVPSAVVTCLAI